MRLKKLIKFSSNLFTNKLRKLIVLIAAITTSIYFSSKYIQHEKEERLQKSAGDLLIFNKKLESLEEQMEKLNWESTCKESITAANLIKRNKYEFQILEPNYSWDEIREVLLMIPKEFCKL
ncbi:MULTISPECIES: hypothetical protein [Prochlorococcus]|uniref:hypothetical protein n=1 Tax=Prochlorococcus TaxID=1218 RepID=UPI000533AB43|nr:MULTISPECIES: hypothetical protein [Prochlorococcus]KGG12318.1 hypothetical protein EV05_1528 [Prochlorococcus sp. MIT 0601]